MSQELGTNNEEVRKIVWLPGTKNLATDDNGFNRFKDFYEKYVGQPLTDEDISVMRQNIGRPMASENDPTKGNVAARRKLRDEWTKFCNQLKAEGRLFRLDGTPVTSGGH